IGALDGEIAKQALAWPEVLRLMSVRPVRRQAAVTAVGPRGAVEQLAVSIPESAHPLGRRANAAAGRLRGLLQRPALLEHAPAEQTTAERAGPLVTVQPHPGSSFGAGGIDTPSLQGGPDEQRA